MQKKGIINVLLTWLISTPLFAMELPPKYAKDVKLNNSTVLKLVQEMQRNNKDFDNGRPFTVTFGCLKRKKKRPIEYDVDCRLIKTRFSRKVASKKKQK